MLFLQIKQKIGMYNSKYCYLGAIIFFVYEF